MNLLEPVAPMTPGLTALMALARALGAEAELSVFDPSATADPASRDRPQALVVDACALADAGTSGNGIPPLPDALDGHPLLILVTRSGPEMDTGLARLTGGRVTGVVEIPHADEVTFPEPASPTSQCSSGVLAGQQYARILSPALGLVLPPGADAEIVMEVAGHPTFVRIGGRSTPTFVWATPTVFDVERPLPAEREFEEALDAYVPGIVFLRAACGDRCWHNPVPGAGLVIDDPLLQPRYGLLDFERLLASARAHHYHVTLAFIPWNGRRTEKQRAQWFLDHADYFSICAHGCDHTHNEFNSDDYDDLIQRNHTAHARMTAHAERTGIPCESLMVCPQEQYSLTGIRAFADSRQFLALVNAGCIPRRLPEAVVTGADVLRPAQDAFFGFPVFKRHYWKDMSAFAMAVFLGKPTILVEHHEFFADGPGPVESFVERLRAMAPQVTWGPLENVVTRTHWRRVTGPGQSDIRFFTDRFQFEHAGATATTYRLLKRFPPSTLIEGLLVNGREVAFERSGDDVTLQIQADEPTAFEINVHITPVQPNAQLDRGLRYTASVAARRALSEFRDSVICRNRAFLRAGKALAKRLRLTGG
ncbi:MAG: hypothetical protein ACKV19_24060 [Verrucomicrobiales bacterium]